MVHCGDDELWDTDYREVVEKTAIDMADTLYDKSRTWWNALVGHGASDADDSDPGGLGSDRPFTMQILTYNRLAVSVLWDLFKEIEPATALRLSAQYDFNVFLSDSASKEDEAESTGTAATASGEEGQASHASKVTSPGSKTHDQAKTRQSSSEKAATEALIKHMQARGGKAISSGSKSALKRTKNQDESSATSSAKKGSAGSSATSRTLGRDNSASPAPLNMARASSSKDNKTPADLPSNDEFEDIRRDSAANHRGAILFGAPELVPWDLSVIEDSLYVSSHLHLPAASLTLDEAPLQEKAWRKPAAKGTRVIACGLSERPPEDPALYTEAEKKDNERFLGEHGKRS